MNQKDKIPALAFLAIGIVAFVAVIGLPFGTVREPDTAFFPLIITVVIIILSLLLLAKSYAAKGEKQVRLWNDRWQKLIPACAALVIYAFLLKPIGYVVCTLLILILFARMEKCSWKATFLVSFLCTFVSYAVFEWYLKSPLPQGILPF